jgi:hypothetical protein
MLLMSTASSTCMWAFLNPLASCACMGSLCWPYVGFDSVAIKGLDVSDCAEFGRSWSTHC